MSKIKLLFFTMNQIHFTPCGNFQGIGCGLLLVERAWEADKSWGPGMEKRGVRGGQGRWKAKEVEGRSLRQMRKRKGAGVFERPGQTIDNLSVFGTSRTSNGLKIEP